MRPAIISSWLLVLIISAEISSSKTILEKFCLPFYLSKNPEPFHFFRPRDELFIKPLNTKCLHVLPFQLNATPAVYAIQGEDHALHNWIHYELPLHVINSDHSFKTKAVVIQVSSDEFSGFGQFVEMRPLPATPYQNSTDVPLNTFLTPPVKVNLSKNYPIAGHAPSVFPEKIVNWKVDLEKVNKHMNPVVHPLDPLTGSERRNKFTNVTTGAQTLTEAEGVGVTSFPGKDAWGFRQVHGVAHVISGLFVTPVSIFITRNYKETFMKSTIIYNKPWFIGGLIRKFILLAYVITSLGVCGTVIVIMLIPVTGDKRGFGVMTCSHNVTANDTSKNLSVSSISNCDLTQIFNNKIFTKILELDGEIKAKIIRPK
ncbi:hypothetical protein Fcan01_14066 [Folsomia candida]|uniref:Uncharacterized protein n=1 Tax=Folsomia candida TaxID=158441 RepID=A0A226E080_FOLCA|nr:hypothetical protein Fcan01_14066 [Folsomia candida]